MVGKVDNLIVRIPSSGLARWIGSCLLGSHQIITGCMMFCGLYPFKTKYLLKIVSFFIELGLDILYFEGIGSKN